MSCRHTAAALLVSTLIAAQAQNDYSQVMPSPPPLPYLDWTACPFEGCAYREWTARKPVTVWDTWKQPRRTTGGVRAGEKVTGLRGVVITFKPGLIRMDRDLPALQLKSGDTLLTYTYLGEGTSVVWSHGRLYDGFDISFTRWPDGSGCGGSHCAATYVDLGQKSWWAEVKFASGQTGWVDMDHSEFDGVDRLARFEGRYRGNSERSIPGMMRSAFW